jgi:calcium permeable stress-gated cation channel
LRLLHLTSTIPNPRHFTVLVRGIPKSHKESCSNVVSDFFTKYHASSYLFHQVVYKVGKVQKIMVSYSSNTHAIQNYPLLRASPREF